jgi:hypothetical protein
MTVGKPTGSEHGQYPVAGYEAAYDAACVPVPCECGGAGSRSAARTARTCNCGG